MTQKLTGMHIDRVDLVDAGANQRRFALFKRDPGAEEAGLIERIAKGVADFLHLPQPVVKTMTFAQIVAGEEMSDALEEHWTTLQSALWSAIYAYDDDGNSLSVDAKKTLVEQNLDEFKAFLLERMDAGVTKSAGSIDTRLFAAFIAKVGKKVSAARLARLKEAADALAAVLAEVEADDEPAETKKRATPQEEDMTPEELATAIAKGNEPLVARIEGLEKRSTPEEPAEAVAKGEGEPEGEEDPVTLEGIAKAVGAIGDRLSAIEKRPGARQSGGGEEAAVKKSNGQWAGIL